MTLSTSIHYVFSWSCFAFNFWIVWKLIPFLSFDRQDYVGKDDNHNGIHNIFISVFYDGCLLVMFFIQHSLMINTKLRSLYPNASRSIYIAGTGISLQVLMSYWCRIPEITFWKFDCISDNSSVLCSVFSLIHLASWTMLYGTSIFMDISEIVGLKQAFYNIFNLGDPLMYKSLELRGFYEHMRHPGFSSLCLIMFVQPVMTLDRLILASSFSLYMVLKFKVDITDYMYQKEQLYIKRSELRCQLFNYFQ